MKHSMLLFRPHSVPPDHLPSEITTPPRPGHDPSSKRSKKKKRSKRKHLRAHKMTWHGEPEHTCMRWFWITSRMMPYLRKQCQQGERRKEKTSECFHARRFDGWAWHQQDDQLQAMRTTGTEKCALHLLTLRNHFLFS